MKIEVNKIITLGNKEKYLVVTNVVHNNNNYYYIAECNENEDDIKDNYKIVKAEEKDNRNSAVQRPDEQRGSYPDRCSRQLFGHSARRLAARAGCRRPVKIKKFPEKKLKPNVCSIRL